MNSLILALHLTAVSLAGAADTNQQNSWTPWYGCWQAEGAPAGEIICIAPTSGGVRLSTLVDGAVQDESNISTSGLARRVSQQGCTGSERARWSSDGQRVFLDSDVVCGNAGRRSVRGMFAFVAPDEWISVQTATQGDSVATRVVRFIAANPQAGAGIASFAVGRGVTEALLSVNESDVAEAVEHMGAVAVDEWMREAGEPFQLGYNDGQQRTGGSALEQVGRFSNPAPVKEVVRIVERPVYVHNYYYDDHYYRWHYSPWSYHYHYRDWRWYHRPVVVIRLPIIISRNVHYHRDYYRDRYRYRYYDNGRYVRWDGRRDRDRDWDRDRNWDRDRDRSNGGRVSRDGYSSGRSARERVEPVATPQPARTTRTVERVSQPRERTSERTSEGTRERTSEGTRERTAQPRERTSERSTPPRERTSETRERSSGGAARESSRSSTSSRSSDGGSRTAKARGSSRGQ